MNIQHPTDRPNFSRVELSHLTVWFSYRTPIAFSYPGVGLVARVNDWSTTTGKHLAHVSDKKDRIRGDVFVRALAIAERGGKLTRERLASMIRGAERDDKFQERARARENAKRDAVLLAESNERARQNAVREAEGPHAGNGFAGAPTVATIPASELPTPLY